MLLLIDNYDSFTWNLFHFLGETIVEEKGVAADAVEIQVHRNDALTVAEAMAMTPKAIVLSPGPRDPDHAGICLELTAAAAKAGVPLMGVCLGHQAIGQAFGGDVVRAPTIMHGKTSQISHQGDGVFDGLPNDLTATRYHSLTLAPETLPADLTVTATTEDGTIMGVEHKQHRVHGVQFHPESIASEHGKSLLRNFLKIAGAS